MLDARGHANDTAVVVFSDHGWQVGEHDLWCKMNINELATRVPFIVRAPWIDGSAGRMSDALVELVDAEEVAPQGDARRIQGFTLDERTHAGADDAEFEV